MDVPSIKIFSSNPPSLSLLTWHWSSTNTCQGGLSLPRDLFHFSWEFPAPSYIRVPCQDQVGKVSVSVLQSEIFLGPIFFLVWTSFYVQISFPSGNVLRLSFPYRNAFLLRLVCNLNIRSFCLIISRRSALTSSLPFRWWKLPFPDRIVSSFLSQSGRRPVFSSHSPLLPLLPSWHPREETQVREPTVLVSWTDMVFHLPQPYLYRGLGYGYFFH